MSQPKPYYFFGASKTRVAVLSADAFYPSLAKAIASYQQDRRINSGGVRLYSVTRTGKVLGALSIEQTWTLLQRVRRKVEVWEAQHLTRCTPTPTIFEPLVPPTRTVLDNAEPVAEMQRYLSSVECAVTRDAVLMTSPAESEARFNKALKSVRVAMQRRIDEVELPEFGTPRKPNPQNVIYFSQGATA